MAYRINSAFIELATGQGRVHLNTRTGEFLANKIVASDPFPGFAAARLGGKTREQISAIDLRSRQVTESLTRLKTITELPPMLGKLMTTTAEVMGLSESSVRFAVLSPLADRPMISVKQPDKPVLISSADPIDLSAYRSAGHSIPLAWLASLFPVGVASYMPPRRNFLFPAVHSILPNAYLADPNIGRLDLTLGELLERLGTPLQHQEVRSLAWSDFIRLLGPVDLTRAEIVWPGLLPTDNYTEISKGNTDPKTIFTLTEDGQVQTRDHQNNDSRQAQLCRCLSLVIDSSQKDQAPYRLRTSLVYGEHNYGLLELTSDKPFDPQVDLEVARIMGIYWTVLLDRVFVAEDLRLNGREEYIRADLGLD